VLETFLVYDRSCTRCSEVSMGSAGSLMITELYQQKSTSSMINTAGTNFSIGNVQSTATTWQLSWHNVYSYPVNETRVWGYPTHFMRNKFPPQKTCT